MYLEGHRIVQAIECIPINESRSLDDENLLLNHLIYTNSKLRLNKNVLINTTNQTVLTELKRIYESKGYYTINHPDSILIYKKLNKEIYV